MNQWKSTNREFPPRACLFPPSQSPLSRLHCVRVLVSVCLCVTTPSTTAPLQRCRPPASSCAHYSAALALTHLPSSRRQLREDRVVLSFFSLSLTRRDDGGPVTGRLRWNSDSTRTIGARSLQHFAHSARAAPQHHRAAGFPPSMDPRSSVHP